VSCAEAEPTPEEKLVYDEVAEVLERSARVLSELQGYRGAGEAIRMVRSLPPSLSPSHLDAHTRPPFFCWPLGEEPRVQPRSFALLASTALQPRTVRECVLMLLLWVSVCAGNIASER
jgi:hypothetical protein